MKEMSTGGWNDADKEKSLNEVYLNQEPLFLEFNRKMKLGDQLI